MARFFELEDTGDTIRIKLSGTQIRARGGAGPHRRAGSYPETDATIDKW